MACSHLRTAPYLPTAPGVALGVLSAAIAGSASATVILVPNATKRTGALPGGRQGTIPYPSIMAMRLDGASGSPTMRYVVLSLAPFVQSFIPGGVCVSYTTHQSPAASGSPAAWVTTSTPVRSSVYACGPRGVSLPPYSLTTVEMKAIVRPSSDQSVVSAGSRASPPVGAAEARTDGGPPPKRMMPLRLLDAAEAKRRGAVCLDGSPPGMYYRNASTAHAATSWVIYFKGGGWCGPSGGGEGGAPIPEGAFDDCAHRAGTRLGSSSHFPAEFGYQGPIDPDRQRNPAFADFNHVVLWYCDGASFTGDRDGTLSRPDPWRVGRNVRVTACRTSTTSTDPHCH